METLFKLTFALRNKINSMKTFKSIHLFTAIMTIAFFMVPVFATAQVDPGGGPDVPIDGGLSLLVAAGAAYGVKKYRDGKKKVEEEK